MSSATYYLICLTAALFAVATSAAIVWRAHARTLRQLEAMELLDALARSSEWAEAQACAVRFQGTTQNTDPALHEIGVLQARSFPELGQAAQGLSECQLHMAHVLSAHERERLRDPEAPLESGADAAFMALRCEHERIVQTMERQLVAVAGMTPWRPGVTSRPWRQDPCG